MTLKRRTIQAFKKLSMPISYKLLDEDKLYDARNVFDNKGVTETRHGFHRFNVTSLDSTITSLSYFKTSGGTRYRLAKSGTAIYNLSTSVGGNVSVKSGLTSGLKHRGVTMSDRHFIGVGSDGLFSFNGTTFTQLGQVPPTGAGVGTSSGGSLANTTAYKVGLTYYSSTTGFETNVFESSQITTSSPNLQIDVTTIPTTADNSTIDKVRVYLKNVTTNSSYLFVTELTLGTTSYTVSSVPTSTQIPPTTHAAPLAGGGKYLTVFGKKLVYTGNSTYPNDVFMSEDYIPDAFDDTTTARTLEIDGDGPNTGIATGLYDNNYLNPFLVIFKKTSITIYSELGEIPVQTTIDRHVGCVSHDTIKVRNGVIFFMSENGWYAIKNGALITKDDMPYSLGGGDIDDIFSREGWSNQLNSAQYENCFSAFYSTLGHYMTFVAEGGNSAFYKAYNYEEKIGGFRVYSFKEPLTCACEGEDDNGVQCVFTGDTTGTVLHHSVQNDRHDETAADGDPLTIPAYIYLPYMNGGDDSVSYRFRSLVVKALSSTNMVTVRAFSTYALSNTDTSEFDFSNAATGFILDESQLDIDVLGEERVPRPYMIDVNRTGEVLMVGFFQDIEDANIGLISSQLSYNRNGNRNT